jgi:hypothetical protein
VRISPTGEADGATVVPALAQPASWAPSATDEADPGVERKYEESIHEVSLLAIPGATHPVEVPLSGIYQKDS